ncbi:MAG: hypothetical protein JSW20_00900 [Nitrospiraceae bacterium]|nr:MAG: hypothetical protein JSW20_00900 [Nitrospiraceae bacterium]
MKKVIIVFIFFISSQLYAQTDSDQSKWDIYLDHAYELTYWDEDELTSWISDQEQQFGESLTQYADTWNNRLFGTSENAGAVENEGGRFPYHENRYKRLAVAELILYITSGDKFRLNESIRVIEVLKGKIDKSDIDFWYRFIHAYDALAIDGTDMDVASGNFVKNIFKIWLNIVLPHEEENTVLKVPTTPVSMKDFAYSMPYLYENIANLIITKAIIQCKLRNVGSLGAVILALKDRLTLENGYSDTVKTVVNRMTGPKSDSNNLFYTVIFLEAEQYRFETQKTLNDAGPSAKAGEAFSNSRLYYNLAYESANTSQGKAAVLSDYLDLISFAYSRLPEPKDIERDNVFATLSAEDGNLTIDKAITLFDQLADADIRVDQWVKHGFAQRKDYVSAMHSLWSSVVELSLWSAYYYEKGISETDIRDYSDKVIKTEAALLQYLEFFENYQKNGYIDIIPDNAYFNAAEAAAKYASLNRRLAPYSKGMLNYSRTFNSLLQYVEIFPFNPDAVMELAHQVNEMGKPGLYVKYVLPIAQKLKESELAQPWNHGEIPDSMIKSVQDLQREIPNIMMRANTVIFIQGNGAKLITEDIRSRLSRINNEVSNYIDDVSADLTYDDPNLKIRLDELIQLVEEQSGNKKDRNGAQLAAFIKKVKEDVISLEEAEKLIADLPRHKETSKHIRKELAQQIDHPLHTVLRQYFYNTSINNQKYYQAISML